GPTPREASSSGRAVSPWRTCGWSARSATSRPGWAGGSTETRRSASARSATRASTEYTPATPIDGGGALTPRRSEARKNDGGREGRKGEGRKEGEAKGKGRVQEGRFLRQHRGGAGGEARRSEDPLPQGGGPLPDKGVRVQEPEPGPPPGQDRHQHG